MPNFNLKFHQKEFSQMMYNPTKVPEDKSIFEYYKELSKYKIFRLDPGKGIDNEKLMFFIICMYDKNSPYRKKFPDIIKRKIEVALDCGFEIDNNGNFTAPVRDFLEGRNEIVNRKIVEYVRRHRNFKYSYIVMIETGYYKLMLDILGGDISKIKEARNIQAELEETILEFLNEDNNPELLDEFLRYMENERIKLRPEDIAQMLQDGELRL